MVARDSLGRFVVKVGHVVKRPWGGGSCQEVDGAVEWFVWGQGRGSGLAKHLAKIVILCRNQEEI